MNMKKAYQKDLWRTIRREKKRFLSILLITMLGIMTLTGVTAACRDLRYSADQFFDRQDLYDISIVSTLGLTKEDVQILAGVDDIEQVEGAYSETVDVVLKDQTQTSEVKVLSRKGFNEPYLVEGRLPRTSDEIAVTQGYLKDAQTSVGDTLTFQEVLKEDEEANFKRETYTITGVVIDAENVNSAEGSAAFRSASQTDYTFFVTPEAVASEVYTAVYLTLTGTKDLACYSDAYRERIDQVVELIETKIMDQRQKARYQAVYGEAKEEVLDAQSKMDQEFAWAEEKLAEAKAKLSDGFLDLQSGERKLEEQEALAKKTIAEAKQEIREGYEALKAGEKELSDSALEIAAGEEQLARGKEELDKNIAQAKKQFSDAKETIRENEEALDQAYKEYSGYEQEMAEAFPGWPDQEWKDLVAACAKGESSVEKEAFLNRLEPKIRLFAYLIDLQLKLLDPDAQDYEQQKEWLLDKKEQLTALPAQAVKLAEGLGQIEAGREELMLQSKLLAQKEAEAEAQFEAAKETLRSSETELKEGKAALEAGKKELADSYEKLAEGEKEIARKEKEAEAQFAAARKEMTDGKKELTEGQEEWNRQEADYERQKQEAQEEIQKAWEKINEIDMTQWYIRDRTALSGYNNIESDSTSIEALGNAFPIVFLIVAILIGLTTITRMVEEERGLIGTYKALGFSNGEISRKYLVFAVLACLIGGLIGDLCGFIVLPKIIFKIFETMYLLPEYQMQFDLMYGIGGMCLFLAGIAGSACYACRLELKQTPAILMRPKAPGAGSRVFLERIPFIWRKLSFLNKVTARNLFRYKKRLFMTVGGIMGCTALVICGFTIKDTVSDLLPKQYEQIYQYDLMAVCEPDQQEQLVEYLKEDPSIGSFLPMQTDSVKVINEAGKEEKVQLYVLPEDAPLDAYIRMEDLSGEALTLKDQEVYLTQNAGRVLGISKGDTVKIRDSKLNQVEVDITQIAQNYLGNMVYMNEDTYEELFGVSEPNGVLADFTDTSTDQIAYADQLNSREGILSVVSTQEMKEDFASAFYLVNMVVYLILILAAGLAFVVLFTLSTTNISERVRELATIKVLGFYDKEVHSYANKETLVLTLIGILFGLPLGHVLGNVLASVLKMPSIQFVASIHPVSYVIAAVLSFCFALAVNLVTNRILDRIDMVEALKSIE